MDYALYGFWNEFESHRFNFKHTQLLVNFGDFAHNINACYAFNFSLCRIADPNFLFYVQRSICDSSLHGFVPMLSVFTANFIISNKLVQYLGGQRSEF